MRTPAWFPRRRDHLDADRVVMVLWNVNGPGGIARTAINLCNQLATHRDVEIISVNRRGRQPRFPVHDSIRIDHLEDQSPEALSAALRARPPSVVITTRPVLHQTAVRSSAGRHVLIGQDHMNFAERMSSPEVKDRIAEALTGLDVFAVLTEADAHDYRAAWPDAPAAIRVMRNATSFPLAESAPELTAPVVLAAGRLVPHKGFDRLVDAFAQVAPDHPGWELHIAGSGPERDRLEAQAQNRGVDAQVRFLGHVDDFDARLRSSSFFAMASHNEGLPMVLIEAMSQGLPTLAYDCPRGPREIIDDGVTGFLVPDGDQDAYVAALRRLIAEPALRTSFGAAALRQAGQYRLETISQQWDLLIDEVVAARTDGVRLTSSES